jgi:hypothetical protein
MTDAMQKTINDKLISVPSCVKELVTLPLPSPPYFVTNIGQAVLEIYTTNSNNIINSTKLTELKINKPYTLLKAGEIHTYLNVFLSMLDKPHDIIGNRVTRANQELLMTNVIIPNLENYMEYLMNINHEIIKNFIIFVKTMLNSFKKPSKNYKVISYENAILYLICKHYSTPPNYSSITTASFDLKPLDQKAPPPPPNNNIVINPDIMNLTTEINNIANQYSNKKIRQYFSVPEVIDHGHVYDIDINTIIEFPENYKEIQLPFDTTNPSSNYITIHSYSTTTNEQDLTNPKLYYNIYVWFTKTDTTTTDPFCLIKYKIPFDKAPDCATVYSSYCSNILTPTSNKFNEIKTLLDDAINLLSLSNAQMKKTIKCLILDQIFNAKSLQDDQNQLQVNQLQTSSPVPVPLGSNPPTQFIGLCTDLASAANGINYYMSQTIRNQNSIVAYYYKTKKIWANKSQIYFYFEGPPANKAAAKDIYNIVTASTSGGNNDKRKRDEEGKEDVSNIVTNTNGTYKRPRYNDTEYEQTYIEEDSNMNTDTNENYYNIDTNKENNDTEFIETQYNIMYDILYEKISGDNILKNNPLRDLKSNVPDNNSEDIFNVLFTDNEKGHYMFEIFSNNFIYVVIELLKKHLENYELIQQLPKLHPFNEFIKWVVNNFLNSDTIISPDNAFGEDRSIEGQIKLSNDLDAQYFEVKNKYIVMFNNQQDPNNSDNQPNKFYKHDDSDRGTGTLVHAGSKSNKKKTNKKRTNKKRAKKRTNKKKIKRTIRKTKKIH